MQDCALNIVKSGLNLGSLCQNYIASSQYFLPHWGKWCLHPRGILCTSRQKAMFSASY